MPRIIEGLLASTLVLLGANQAHAQATIRLGGTGDATVQTLDSDVQADTEEVAWRGGRYYGFGRYYGRGYVGYRRFYYRPYAYWPYYAYRPYRYFYPAYFGGASYYYNVPTYGVYANPSAAVVTTQPPATTPSTSGYGQAPNLTSGVTPERMPPPLNKVKREGNDPAQTAPMPIPERLPPPTIRKKTTTVPLEGRVVSAAS